jgi:hypothetical protein
MTKPVTEEIQSVKLETRANPAGISSSHPWFDPKLTTPTWL